MLSSSNLVLTSIMGMPLISPGDDIAQIIFDSVIKQEITVRDGDIFVLAQKIISKAENRFIDLMHVRVGVRAKTLSFITKKDARLIELILRESNRVLRVRRGLIIVEHKLGFVCANAGIDHSNSVGGQSSEDIVLLLPENPDFSAKQIKEKLNRKFGKQIGIQIIDSHGRAWRNGTVGTTIGIAGFPGLVDLRGKSDLFGYKLKITQVAAADELAAGASLLMGQADEGIPCIHVHGFPYEFRQSSLTELIRPKEMDLFR